MLKDASSQRRAWATCSPVNFRGCEIYASRDAGLVGRGFRINGLDCGSILLAPEKEGDLPDIVRAEYREMESADWWEEMVQNGVVFYNSANPNYRSILGAVKDAGLPIALNVDSTALFDLYSSPREFWQKAIMHKSNRSFVAKISFGFASALKSCYRRLLGKYHLLADHIACADVIAAVTPDAATRLRRFLGNYGQSEAVHRVHTIPHPVHPRFVVRGEKATEGPITFVTVGRWDDIVQKRTDLLLSVVESLLISDSATLFRLFGKVTPAMKEWHNGLDSEKQKRVELNGVVPNAELVEAYQMSHIYLCVSAYESFLISAAEAMCCGCSIIACDSPVLPGPRWFASAQRGTLSRTLSSTDLVNASLLEVSAWREGKRQPNDIASWAQSQMHADRVAWLYKDAILMQREGKTDAARGGVDEA